jgi:hypothetical protein
MSQLVRTAHGVKDRGAARRGVSTAAVTASEGADVAAFAGQAGEPPIIITIPGGGYRAPLRPPLVEGVGYGVLPELEGEAHGTVGSAAKDELDELELLMLLLAA